MRLIISVIKFNNCDINSSKGFTLLELVISLVILSISFFAILPLLMTTLNLNKTTDMATIARDLATQKVEEIMRLPDKVIRSSSMMGTNTSFTETRYVTAKGVEKSAAAADTPYTRILSINQVTGVTTTPIPVIITAVVQYTYNGQTRTRSFSTMWSF